MRQFDIVKLIHNNPLIFCHVNFDYKLQMYLDEKPDIIFYIGLFGKEIKSHLIINCVI